MTDKIPSNNPLPNKERIKLPRQRVPEQDAQVRAHNFCEVNLGFPAEQARQESLRCIECPKPGCVDKCPVSVNVRAVIDLILAGDYLGAASKVREDNALPGAGRRFELGRNSAACWSMASQSFGCRKILSVTRLKCCAAAASSSKLTSWSARRSR